MTRLSFPLFLLPLAAIAVVPSDAGASTAVALSVRELASTSDAIVRVTQLAKTSAWEDGRIVTTSKVRVDRVVAGAPPASELSIRTLGGVVGEIGQYVEGEADLAPGEQAVLFVTPVRAVASTTTTMRVVGRAQGRWSIARDARAQEIVRVRGPGRLVERRGEGGAGTVRATAKLAASLDGATLDEATSEAAREWSVSHAR